MSPQLQQLVSIVQDAASLMAHATHSDMDTHLKSGRRDMVTVYDARIQQQLVEQLSRSFPGVGFLCEEGESLRQTQGLRFVIDPIDGTANFVHGTGCCATSVGLVDGDTPVMGVVCDPFTGETFAAEKGQGATLNGCELPRIDDVCLADSLVCLGSSLYFPELYQKTMDLLAARGREFNDIRRDGSAALDCCYTAAGRFGLFFEMTLAPWDYAAGSLVASECGAFVGTMQGQPLVFDRRTSVLVGAPTAVREFLAGQTL